MAKLLRCKDFGTKCGFEARAESEEEVVTQAVEHAKTHGLKEVPAHIVAMIRLAIHDTLRDE